MTKDLVNAIEVTANARNVLVGAFTVDGHAVIRTAAHLYRVTSDDGKKTYTTYVESLRPKVGRCSCQHFVVSGEFCKHLDRAVAVERWIVFHDPQGHRDENARRREARGV